jgi:hypothetical protein
MPISYVSQGAWMTRRYTISVWFGYRGLRPTPWPMPSSNERAAPRHAMPMRPLADGHKRALAA